MKEKLYKFRLLFIIAAVAVIFVVAAVIIRLVSDPSAGETESYFSQSQYPASCEERKDGSVYVTVDGSATPDLSWIVTNETEDLCDVATVRGEKDNVLTVSVSPKEAGYASVLFSREMEVYGQTRQAVVIHFEGVVEEDDDGNMWMRVSDIYQDAASFGAADTDTPYIIEGSQVLLPGGGDWELSEIKDDAEGQDEGLFTMMNGTNDDHVWYLAAYPSEGVDEDALSDVRFELKSEKLGITQRLKYRINEIGDGELMPVDEES